MGEWLITKIVAAGLDWLKRLVISLYHDLMAWLSRKSESEKQAAQQMKPAKDAQNSEDEKEIDDAIDKISQRF